MGTEVEITAEAAGDGVARLDDDGVGKRARLAIE
jgi:hypothetical protein